MKKRRLLPDIVSITPSNYDDFMQCERRFLNRHLLGLPPSDPGAANETGLLVHDLLGRPADRAIAGVDENQVFGHGGLGTTGQDVALRRK